MRTEIENPPRRESGSWDGRRQSPSRGQVAEQESDLTRAASSDRRYLPEGRERRGRKLEPEAPLDLPHGPKIVSRRERGRTSEEASPTTTTSPRARPTSRSRTQSSNDSRKSSSRRITERSAEKLDSKEKPTSRTLGRRIIERSSRRNSAQQENFSPSSTGSASSSFENTPPIASRRSSPESPESVTFSRRGSKHSLFAPGEFENFDPPGDIQTEINFSESTPIVNSTPKLRSHGRRAEPTFKKPKAEKPESSTKSAKTEKRLSSEKFSRFKARSEALKSRTPKIEIITVKPKVIKNDNLRSSKGFQPRGKTPGKIDKLGSSRSEITSETTTETSPEVTTPQSGQTELTPSFAASESLPVSTPVLPTISSESASSPSPSGEGKENVNKRRQAGNPANPLPAPPKEDYFNHGLGFRGRKPHAGSIPDTTPGNPASGNPGWTLKRRPHSYDSNQSGATHPSVTTNEIPAPARRRQQLTSVVFKIDREITPEDNYPPEFKAKLAKLVS